MQKRSLTVFALLLVVCLAIFLTSGSAVAQSETVKIGYNAPLSGPAAAWGLPGLEVFNLTLHEMTEIFSIFEIKQISTLTNAMFPSFKPCH